MTKSELIALIAEKNGMKKKDAEELIASILEAVEDSLAKGEKVQLAGFGTFDVKVRAAHKGRNPFTGDAMDIPETKHISFTAGKILKEKIKD